MPPTLPGFYYDSEKGKYFKIIPNQHATASASHSKAAVDEERMKYREGKELERWHQELRKTRIQRNHLLQIHPLGGMLGLGREIGHQEGHSDFATAAIWAKGLERYQFIEKPSPPTGAEPARDIHHFIRDPGTGAIAWTEEWSNFPTHVNVPQVRLPIPNPDGQPNHVSKYFMADGKPLAIMPNSETSSLSISPDRVVLATGLGMTSAPSIHLTRLLEPHEYRDSFNHVRDRQRPHDYHWPTAYLPPIDGDVTNTIRLPTKVNTIWCSAAGPQTYHAVFAVGTSRGAAFVALSNVAVHSWVLDYTWPDKGRSHDTLALDFWTESNLLCGMRSGKVRLWDMRANGSNVRFRHGSCVSHIRVVGENKVLVAGLENRLALYDLRFIKPYPQSNLSASEGIGEAPAYQPYPPSLPLHTFPAYRMKEYIYPRLGFDVYRNLVATGTEDKKVQIFDLHSGRELQVGNQDRLPADTLMAPARCLKFVEHGFNGDGLRLLVANGRRIDAWAW